MRITMFITLLLRKESTLKSSFINANLTKTEKRELKKALNELMEAEIVNEDGETVNYYDTKVWDEISANEELILDTMTCAGTDFLY